MPVDKQMRAALTKALAKRAKKKKTRIPRGIKSYSSNIGMPVRKFQKLTYVENITFTPNLSGAHSVYEFSLNSCYDPNTTGVGRQVYGWDQLSPFYKQYRVHSVNITTQWANAATNVFPVYVGVTADKNGSVEALLETKLENNKMKNTHLLLINSREKVTFKETIKMKDYFQVKNVADDHQLQAVVTSSPALPAPYIVWAQFANGHPGTTSNAICMTIKIDYNVELFDPVELVGS